MAALPYVLENDTRREAAVVYLTDALMTVSGNTAIYENGRIMGCRFADIIEPKRKAEETRTGEEIIAHMKELLGR